MELGKSSFDTFQNIMPDSGKIHQWILKQKFDGNRILHRLKVSSHKTLISTTHLLTVRLRNLGNTILIK